MVHITRLHAEKKGVAEGGATFAHHDHYANDEVLQGRTRYAFGGRRSSMSNSVVSAISSRIW